MKTQKEICHKYKAKHLELDESLFIAISKNFNYNAKVFHGLRHPIEGTINGWYLWTDQEIDTTDDAFFVPICLSHLIEKSPLMYQFLGMEPGWRFLLAEDGNYIDVWYDNKLLL